MKKILFIIIILLTIGAVLYFTLLVATMGFWREEGEEGREVSSGVFVPSFMLRFACKPGLTAIIGAKELNNGECAYPMCDCYVCTKCGDNICGIGENKCNCSKDCK